MHPNYLGKTHSQLKTIDFIQCANHHRKVMPNRYFSKLSFKGILSVSYLLEQSLLFVNIGEYHKTCFKIISISL